MATSKDRNDVMVYFHLNPNTREVFYVGIGVDRRPWQTLQRSQHWKNYVTKHGSPIVEIVHNNLLWEDACSLERKYISSFGRKDRSESGKLINHTDGGEGVLGRSFSAESKEKLRKAHTGKVMSKESREKMSASKTGMSYEKPAIQMSVVYFTKDGKRVKDYKKIRDVATDGFNPLMASRIAQLKADRCRDKSFFVLKRDEVCPAYIATRVVIANQPRKLNFAKRA